MYVLLDTNKHACLSRENKKSCYFNFVIDKTIFFRRPTEHTSSIKTIIEVLGFRDYFYLNSKVYT